MDEPHLAFGENIPVREEVLKVLLTKNIFRLDLTVFILFRWVGGVKNLVITILCREHEMDWTA